ncbi:MAG: exodeoxyribonuclease V subunit gamma [Butyrivibrio sp.]|nr:exodeoxyribonuclease V subunit gamma [Butyrivibrio sp.]
MLRFVFGASGSGKSFYIRREIIERSLAEPDRNFLIVVPDQFTMQTQLDIVKQHPRHGIMNIDVVSFSRLSHRIFEEIGEEHGKVLDDMGKSLVLRHVAETIEGDLPIIGKNMHKMGYIDEVKSTISEFMQYRIEPEELDSLIKLAEGKGALKAKLLDLQRLYAEFKSYIKGNYIAQEEMLQVLCSILPKSKLIPGSVIAFDGFTGFTPVQYQVIGELLRLSEEVIYSCNIGDEENPYAYIREAEQELFLLSKKTVHDLLRLEYENEKMADSSLVPDFDRWASYRNENSRDVRLKQGENSRHHANKELAFLEENLFRYNNNTFNEKAENIKLFEADTIQDEVNMALSEIKTMIRDDKSLQYRDFAIVCGSLERYESLLEKTARDIDIPIYIDQTGNLKLNPLVELIRSAIKIVTDKYTYEAVFHYLRSGLSDFSRQEADKLENYVRALGIRGKNAWENEFTKIPRSMERRLKPEDEDGKQKVSEFLSEINSMREKLVTSIKPLFDAGNGSVKEFSVALYEFLEAHHAEEKLAEKEGFFHENGDELRAKEYGVIYRKVIELIDQIAMLFGDENISLKEYSDILDVGFSDISIGTIPQNVDRIVVGDIERTRLNEVKVLFFLGVTDDLIPKGVGTGGIISDIERQFLVDLEPDVELAPTPRQQMYTQRLYLYMNLTKPSEKLFLTYAHLDGEGASLRPAYLIGKIKSMFPGIGAVRLSEKSPRFLLQTDENSMSYIARHMQDYALGYMSEEKERDFRAIFHSVAGLGDDRKKRLKNMQNAAGMSYRYEPLSRAVASMLYGNVLSNSVSRLEKFAQCSYAHFLQYGLRLDDREEFSFERSDLGNVFHGVLETFSVNLEKEGLNWLNFTKEQGEQILDKSLDEFASGYGGEILQSSKRSEYSLERIRRIMRRSVDTLQYQLSKGSFMPKSVETSFSAAGEIDAINIDLTDDEKSRIRQKMKLTGTIDRIDTYEDSDHVFVKIIDFKSGDKNFDLCSLYYGLQLQLVLYMNVARSMEKAENPGKEVVPAAILYYHVADPVLKGDDIDSDETEDDINARIRKELRTKGLVRADKDVVTLLDRDMASSSDVVPVSITAKGEFSKKGSSVMEAEDFEEVSRYVTGLIKKSGKRILSGDIQVNPYEMGEKTGCKYCGFKSICGFDETIPGYCTNEMIQKDDDEILLDIKKENE